MTKTLPFVALLGTLLCLGQTALAQSTTDPATPPADAAAAGDLAMGQDPAAGLPNRDQAQIGATYLAQSFDAWQQRCAKTETPKDPCQLYQLLRDAEGNSVAEISMFALPDGGQAVAGATFMAPLETLLTAQLRITVDAGQTRIYPFAFCTKLGCVARLGFTAEEVEAFRKGAKATITIVPAAAPDTDVNLDLSLKGFTAGYQAVAASTAP